eukprot:scaffold8011_cov146-Isochrysis_galbana.AAC.1
MSLALARHGTHDVEFALYLVLVLVLAGPRRRAHQCGYSGGGGGLLLGGGEAGSKRSHHLSRARQSLVFVGLQLQNGLAHH